MKVVVYGVTDEIMEYTEKFWDRVDYIVSDVIDIEKREYRGRNIKDIISLLKDKDVFIIVSNIVNKQKSFKVLEVNGYVKGRDFVWGPDWLGDENLPACYPIKSWEENAYKYNFSGEDGPWDNRYRELITLLDAECNSIMDCGAGNMSLKRMLNTKIKYIPVDNVPRNKEIIICDFNKGEFPEIHVDTAIASGILEYIIFPEKFIMNLCDHSKKVILSYCSLHMRPNISYRMSLGWKNHLTEGEIVKLFYQNGFILDEELYINTSGLYLSFKKIYSK